MENKILETFRKYTFRTIKIKLDKIDSRFFSMQTEDDNYYQLMELYGR